MKSAGWRFFDSDEGPANISLEQNTKITEKSLSNLGDDFQKIKQGYIDFLLLDEKGFPLIVLEAKREELNPLVGKEQARKYARAVNCRFVLLSNGNLHYFWDIDHGNPYIITQYPRPKSIKGYKNHKPDADRLIKETVHDDYIARSILPNYQDQASWKNESERSAFVQKNKLRFLRHYQKRAIHALQNAVKKGSDRFLFEMATGTGKTLTSAAVIKLFLRTGNARRVLFLVDRLELEDQAYKSFVELLKNDYKTVIYKENRDDWRKAEIVVSTVQSFLFNNKYQSLFSPTDFDMVISDEAHRSIGGNARAVFEYFIGYKLGLTATPRDFLKKVKSKTGAEEPRDMERRLLLDTYRTFGCDSGVPTYRYSLLDGVKDGFLINPIVVDARSDVSTQLLSDEGYIVLAEDESGDESEATYTRRDFEKKFYSKSTNRVFCETMINHGLRDPISNEFGKTIVFAVSQNHAAKLTQILNEIADARYPGKYNSDFAVQVTSIISDAQRFTINFTNNKLNGSENAIPNYKTSKTRICVTVGMMTTGYDCPDLLNLALMRPIFSPTDFIQMKGRGTRTNDFRWMLFNEELKAQISEPLKKNFKLFDFFGNCEYFEDAFNYDEIIELPKPSTGGTSGGDPVPTPAEYENFNKDHILSYVEEQIGADGMKIDRMFFEQFEEIVQADETIREYAGEGRWELVIEYLNKHILNKPEAYFTLEKLRKATGVNRRLGMREMVEKALGFIDNFKSKDDLMEEEFQKFIADFKPQSDDNILALKYFFKAYITDNIVRDIIENNQLTDLNINPTFSMEDFKAVPRKWRFIIPEYIKDYVPLNQFME